MNKKSWYSITNKSAEVAEITIYEEIGFFGVTAKDFCEEMKGVGDRKIVLRLNSPGGDVFDGLAIYNRLKEHAPGVEVRIDGLAASMASVIAMAGAPIRMAENAMLMIHNPNGLVAGDSDDMREFADVMDKVKGALITAYERRLVDASARSSTDSPDIAALMDAETWFTAAEALAAGFVDEITPALKIAATFDTRRFRNAPNPIANPMILRASILTALALTETPAAPLTDEQIFAAFNKSLGDVNALIVERDDFKGKATTARTEADELKGKLDTAELTAKAKGENADFLISAISTALALTPEQITNLVSDKTIVPVAIETLAGRKAVAIAAAQGIPPVITDPGDKKGADAIKADFDAAAAEPDPRKRGQMFAAASKKLSATAGRN